ncbi:hypothetical protein ACCO45_012788 [Purpureocillium lilacinum]|uniref:Uncharacterized protein n=1 Tax=Purpureocillium lilacinum TaxID=33203 RepID=A0ACC4D909_PURLI
MASTDTTKGVTRLRSNKDWEVWSDKFMMKAIDLNIWSLVDTESNEEPMHRPHQPDFADYPRRVQGPAATGSAQSTQRSTTRRQGTSRTQTSDTVEEEIQVASEAETEWGHETLRARGYHELIARDREIYNRAAKDYDRRYQAFKDQQAALSKPRTWVMDTISDHYYTTCCKGETSMRKWYRNLADDANVDHRSLRCDARERYRAALKPLSAPPADFGAWINRWKEAFAYASSKEVSDVQFSDEWLDDLIGAVRKIMPNWGSIRVTRGAFGPTFGPESEETPAEPKEPTEDRRAKAKPRYERQNRSNPRKRGRPATEEGCYACGSRSHSVPKCYYVNKSIAPATFRGNPTIQLGIEARLQKDTAFAEEIKRQIKPKEEFNDKQ